VGKGRILVTGAGGKLGQAVVEELVTHDYDVVGADRRPPPVQRPGARFTEVELGDVGQVAAAMSGARAVIHLGAIPGPNRHPDDVVFGNNTLATFAVLQGPLSVAAQRVDDLGAADRVHGVGPLRDRTGLVSLDVSHHVPAHRPVHHRRYVGDLRGGFLFAGFAEGFTT